MFVDIWLVPLDEGSVRRKAPSYTEEHKHRKGAYIRPSSRWIPTHCRRVGVVPLDRVATVAGTKT
jgi:hypothetical protein